MKNNINKEKHKEKHKENITMFCALCAEDTLQQFHESAANKNDSCTHPT